jgi:short-subunit dehydrogenase
MRQKATRLYQLRGLQPETVAKAALRAVLRNKPVVAIGFEAHSMRFISRYMPGLSRVIARIGMVPR